MKTSSASEPGQQFIFHQISKAQAALKHAHTRKSALKQLASFTFYEISLVELQASRWRIRLHRQENIRHQHAWNVERVATTANLLQHTLFKQRISFKRRRRTTSTEHT